MGGLEIIKTVFYYRLEENIWQYNRPYIIYYIFSLAAVHYSTLRIID